MTFRLFDGKNYDSESFPIPSRRKKTKTQESKPLRRQNEIEKKEIKRKYLTITEVQNEYLPVSKKKIRSLAKRYLSVKMIGGRMFVSREELEELLTDDDNAILPLS